MPQITQEQLDNVLQNAPQGTSPEGIKAGLVARGYSLPQEQTGDKTSWLGKIVKAPASLAVSTFNSLASLGNLAQGKTQEAAASLEKPRNIPTFVELFFIHRYSG